MSRLQRPPVIRQQKRGSRGCSPNSPDAHNQGDRWTWFSEDGIKETKPAGNCSRDKNNTRFPAPRGHELVARPPLSLPLSLSPFSRTQFALFPLFLFDHPRWQQWRGKGPRGLVHRPGTCERRRRCARVREASPKRTKRPRGPQGKQCCCHGPASERKIKRGKIRNKAGLQLWGVRERVGEDKKAQATPRGDDVRLKVPR